VFVFNSAKKIIDVVSFDSKTHLSSDTDSLEDWCRIRKITITSKDGIQPKDVLANQGGKAVPLASPWQQEIMGRADQYSKTVRRPGAVSNPRQEKMRLENQKKKQELARKKQEVQAQKDDP
jgi:hypothetical protein